MKWLRTLVIFDRGGVVSSSDWREIHESYVRSIQSIDFPRGTGALKLRRKFRRPDGQWNRNGVGYLRRRFLDHMVKEERWRVEVGFDLGKNRQPEELRLYPGLESHREPIKSEFGDFDLVTTAPEGTHVAIEWETGNISSSHRSMNKLAIALAAGKIKAGVLILPSRDLYEHLTDRIGNISELSGYLSMWKALEPRVDRGLLAITVVEHDVLTDDTKFQYLPVGDDGRAREGRSKKSLRKKRTRSKKP
jgi:hypothetical protein